MVTTKSIAKTKVASFAQGQETAASPLILLTGATGFVGHHVLTALIERDQAIRLVVREGKQNTIQESPAIEKVITTPDLWSESAEWWTSVCRGVDGVIHVAWHVDPNDYLQSPKNQECLQGTLRLAQGAAQAKVRRLVGIGTCFEYDLSAGDLTIHTPLRPLTPYAEAKVATFRALFQSLPQQGMEFVWCRLFYLYGEGEKKQRLVPYLHRKLKNGEPAELTSGEQVRDYLDVREAGERIVNAALGTAQGPVNICSGIPVTIRQLAERIADGYGRRDLLRFGARPDNPADPPCIVGIPG